MFHCDKQDIPKAKSHEINPRGIEIAEVDFVSPNKLLFQVKRKNRGPPDSHQSHNDELVKRDEAR
ncbi:hypothetical protein JHK82_018585 [Glycine max]|nr:hypothetical protein JHK82_018585 [Glycine max]